MLVFAELVFAELVFAVIVFAAPLGFSDQSFALFFAEGAGVLRRGMKAWGGFESALAFFRRAGFEDEPAELVCGFEAYGVEGS